MPKTDVGEMLRFLFCKQLAAAAIDRSDRELLKHFAATREDAPFTVLFERHRGMVMGVCKRILGDLHLAEDSFQATFHVLARQAGSIHLRGTLGPWLYRVAQRTALHARTDVLRRRVQERRYADIPHSHVLDDGSWQEISRVIDEALGALPEKYSAPLVLCYFENKGRDLVARELGWAEGTVARRLERGRELLRRQLVKRGISLSAGALAATIAEKALAVPVTAAIAMKTIKAATLTGSGQAAVGAYLSAQAVLLAEETMKGMFIVKVKMLVLALTMALGIGGGAWAGIRVLVNSEHSPGQETQAINAQAAIPDKEKVPTDRFGDALPQGAAARLGTVRFRHVVFTNYVTFAESGKTMVVRTISGFELFDAATGKRRKVLSHLPTGIHLSGIDLGTSSDGTQLAVPDTAKRNEGIAIALWDLPNNKKVRTLQISIDDDQVAPKAAATANVNYLSFSPGGTNLAVSYTVGLAKGRAIIVDCATAKTLVRLEEGQYDLLAFAPDGKTIATLMGTTLMGTSRQKLQLREVSTGKVLHTFLEDQPKPPFGFGNQSVAFSHDGKMLAAKNHLGQISIFDLSRGNEITQLKSPVRGQNTLMALAFTHDDKGLMSCEFPSGVQEWDLETGNIVRTLNLFPVEGLSDGRATTAAFAPDLQKVALGYHGGRSIRTWDMAQGKELFTEYHGHHDQVSALSFSQDAKTLASVGSGGAINLWDVASEKIINKAMDSQANHHSVSFSPNGSVFVTTNDNNFSVHAAAADMNSPRAILRGRGAVAVFSQNGRQLFTVENQALDKDNRKPGGGGLLKGGGAPRPLQQAINYKRFLRRWDLETGLVISSWPLPDQAVAVNAAQSLPDISGNGKMVFMRLDNPLVKVPGRSSDIHVFFPESQTGRMLRGQDNEAGGAFAASPDGRMTAAAFSSVVIKQPVPPAKVSTRTENAGIRLWEVITGKEISVFKDQHFDVAAWSKDGRMIACAGKSSKDQDRSAPLWRIFVWDSATGQLVTQFGDVPAGIMTLAFSPDTKYLAAGLGDTTILLYDIGKVDPRFKTATKLTKTDLVSRWAELGGENATAAHQALGALVLSPMEAVAFLRERLKPAVAVDAGNVQKWLAELDSEVFATRQAATKALEAVADEAEQTIINALKRDPPLETRRRLDQILMTLVDSPPAETVRAIRAIMVLERIGSPEAQAVLATLGKGAPRSRVTEEAQESIERLANGKVSH